ncbi:MAG: Hsp70 family protein, partial [Geodermatophilaceae bacterium]|nr:Hsp70 family protein [Geodermatophilaceae bacterium]
GIVHVHAKDLGTGKEQSMTITGGSALPKDDIARMMADAEAHAEEDKARREEAETRNMSESMVYQTEKFLAENGDKLPEDKRTELGEALSELKSTLGGSDAAAIKASSEKLSRLSQEAGAALYAEQQATGAAGEGAGAGTAGAAGAAGGAGAGGFGGDAPADDSDVVDAEIVDDDSEQK